MIPDFIEKRKTIKYFFLQLYDRILRTTSKKLRLIEIIFRKKNRKNHYSVLP